MQREAMRLTRREMQVVVQTATGVSNKEVGRKLNITEGTVKMHLNSIYKKLGFSNRTKLAMMFAEKK